MSRPADTPLLDGIGPGPQLAADIMRAVTAQAIVALDADGEMVCCNDAALRIHGRTSGPDPATWPATGLFGPPLDGSGSDTPIGPLLHRLSASGPWTGRVECRHTAGGTVTADMTVTRRHPDGFVLVYQEGSTPAAGPALTSGPMLSMLGHEMRSPLTGIIGLARMLLRKLSAGPPDPESQVRQLTLLLTSASQMLRLTEQVADIARLQSGLTRPGPAVIDCRHVVTEAVRGQEPAAAARKLRLLVEDPDEPVLLSCEAGLLGRLLRELIGNAVQHTNGADVRIRIRADGPDTVLIEVADDGPAIPAGERTRIFEPFERGSAGTARDEGGAGLGLYLARQLAHELGGALPARCGPPGHHLRDRAPPGPADRLISRPRHRPRRGWPPEARSC